jgi:hypothetical protein
MVRRCMISGGALLFVSVLGGCEERPRGGASTPGAAQAPPTGAAAAGPSADARPATEAAPETQGPRWSLQWAQLRSSPSDGQKAVTDSSELERILRELPLCEEGEGFVILTEHTGRFMQAVADRQGRYMVECHDTVADRRAQADDLSADEASAAFREFMQGRYDFPDRAGWIRIRIDGAPMER